MALARARVAAKKTKDRWKAKQWYKITAPGAFNNAALGETLTDEPEHLKDRTVEVTLSELTGDMKQMHVKLTFQVTGVQDNNARTRFVGHDMTSDYIRRLTRRGNNKIPAVFDLQTTDGSRVRVKPMAVAERRSQTTQAQEIRRIMGRMLTDAASKNNLAGFLQEILVNDLGGRILKEARKIHPLRRIEIAKTEILAAPTIEVDETPIISAAPAAPADVPLQEGAEPKPATEAAEASAPGAVVEEEKVEDLTDDEEQ